MRYFLINLILASFLLSITLAPFLEVRGQTGVECDPDVELCNPITSNTFGEVIRKVANIAALIGLPIVVIMIIWAGFLFVSSQGSEEKLKTAKTTLFWAVIGALLVVGAFAIAIAIENFASKL